MQKLFNNWVKRSQLLIHMAIWALTAFSLTTLVLVLLADNAAIEFKWMIGIGVVIGLIFSSPLLLAIFHLNGAIGQLSRGEIPIIQNKWYAFPLKGLLDRFSQLVEQQRPFVEQRQVRLQQVRDTAAQEVRNRLARDLHDSIKQQLFSIQMSAAAAQARFEQDPAGALTSLNDIRQSSHEALVEMGALLDELAPQSLENIGLTEAIKKQAEALGYRTGAEVNCEIEQLPADEYFPEGAQEGIFRIVQEAFSNIARHARAKNVTLTLKTVGEQLQLFIEDDGQGFNRSAGDSRGMGLENIQKRIELFGGSLNLQSAVDAGTRITLWLPLVNLLVLNEDLANKQRYPISRQFAVSLAGAGLTILFLRYPLYIVWPINFVQDWLGSAGQISIPALVLFCGMAVFTMIGVGTATAWLVPREGRWQNGLAGGANGMLAGSLAWFATVAPAAGIWGHQATIQHGVRPTLDNWHFLHLLSESVTGIGVGVIVSFWACLSISWGLGLLGGLFVNRQPGTPSNRQQATISRLSLAFQTIVLILLMVIVSVTMFELLIDQIIVANGDVQTNSSYQQSLSPTLFRWLDRLTAIALLGGSGLFFSVQFGRVIRNRQSDLIDLAGRLGLWLTLSMVGVTYALTLLTSFSNRPHNQLLLTVMIILTATFGWQTWQAWRLVQTAAIPPIAPENQMINRGTVLASFLELGLFLIGGVFFGFFYLIPNLFRNPISQALSLPNNNFNWLDIGVWFIILIVFGGAIIFWRRFESHQNRAENVYNLSSWSTSILSSETDTLLPKSMLAIASLLVFIPISLNMVLLSITAIPPLSAEAFPYPEFDPTWLVDSLLLNYRTHLLGIISFIFSSFVMFATIYVVRRMLLSGRINFLSQGLQDGESLHGVER